MDGLTGIANRRYFDELLDKEWKRAAREKFSMSLIMLDIDFFKNYNDNYGHQAGDDCLRKLATAIRNSLHRPADFLARYGGEEFAVVLPETNEEGALKLGRTVQANIEKLKMKHSMSSVSPHVTASLGIATTVPEPSASYDLLVTLADKALYKAKNGGRNQINVSIV